MVADVCVCWGRFKDPIHPKRDLKHVIADEEGFLLVTLNGHEERSGKLQYARCTMPSTDLADGGARDL